jgi:four helix bundle protein
MIIDLTRTLNHESAATVMINQIIRSSTSPALNYGEATGAESQKDFIHKMQVVLKELRETFIALKIIEKAKLCKNNTLLNNALDECNQLISIFVKSITTNKKKQISKV